MLIWAFDFAYAKSMFSHDLAYHNNPKFSDRQAWANSADQADQDQTAPRGAAV